MKALYESDAGRFAGPACGLDTNESRCHRSHQGWGSMGAKPDTFIIGDDAVPQLFDPFTLRGVTLRNRVGVSPMCQYWAEGGTPSDWHLVHLGSRAVGGAGLVVAEATAVEARGRITPKDAGIWSDEHVEPWARVARFVAEYGAVPGIQLAHAGRKASTAPPWLRGSHDDSLGDGEEGWEPVGPSAVPFRDGSRVPRALTKPDLLEVQSAFAAAATRAKDAGFRWLELHFAHGYLAHSFLSPLSNRRTDEYGGPFDNRVRFAVETVRAVRRKWPDDLPLTVRLSVTDWVAEGWKLDDSVELAKRLKAEGVDLIDCSSGGAAPGVNYATGPGWQVPLAEAVRSRASIPTAAVGMITGAKQADEIIRTGRADLVMLATEMLIDPYWPFHAAKELNPDNPHHMPPPYDYVVNPAKH